MIIETILSYIPAKHKLTPSGWRKFNAPCCINNGNSADTRQRGGLIYSGETISYSCFNCGYKASYTLGRPLSKKMRSLLEWFGTPSSVITKLVFEAMKCESSEEHLIESNLPTFNKIDQPTSWIPLLSAIEDFPESIPVAEYVANRGFYLDDYLWYWDSKNFKDRVVIPFYYESELVGWTSRKITPGMPKYLASQQSGYVFNLDAQTPERKYVIICEGPLDAISIDGIAVLGAEISDKQTLLINRLGKLPIVLPDRDKRGHQLIEKAIDMRWAVSMPEWETGIKDINDALLKYGKIYTLRSIIASAEHNELKIRLRMKKWQ